MFHCSSFISLTSKFGWLEVFNFLVLILEVSGSPVLSRYILHSNNQIKKITIKNKRPYKMAKFDKQSLCQKYFFSMTLLHAYAQYIFTASAKHQKGSVKALVQMDFPVYALSKHKQSNREKMATFTKLSFWNFFMQMFNVSILHKQSIRLFQQNLWYKYALSMHKKSIKNYKGQ